MGSNIDDAVNARADSLVATLLESVRIPSVSLTGQGIAEAVAFLRAKLLAWGFEVEVHDTACQPIIFAEIGPKNANPTNTEPSAIAGWMSIVARLTRGVNT